MTGYCAALPHPNGTSVIVIAGGQSYVIDPEERRLLADFGGGIDIALAVPSANLIVTGKMVRLEAWDNSGLRWRSRRVSWDGMRDLHIEDDKVKGEALGLDDREFPW